MGDARHQARPSDHNLGNAFDITHDPSTGCHGDVIASAALQDPRTKYVIWNRRIWNLERGDRAWRHYTGDNPHTHHCHVSIRSGARNDTRPWGWAPGGSADVTPPPAQATPPSNGTPALPSEQHPYPGVPLKKGDRSESVRAVQTRLRRLGWRIGIDAVFGPETDRVVRAFQRRRGLEDDGIVGPRTWRALFS
ncbi:MAG: peptidoglycan-binding protein [Polyangiaceae bacterium]|nr:peptidoglycan-binding protein [Polyangiaceae bacterium]